MRISLFWRVLPAHLLIVAFLAFPLWLKHEAASQALQAGHQAETEFSSTKQTQLKKLEGIPTKVLIPSLSIDVPVVSGTYNKSEGSWTVAPDAANYATNTAKVNNINHKTLIYGHWTPQVFGPTKKLAKQDVVYVYTNNKQIFKYVYTGNTVVQPSDTQIFSHLKGQPGLVLMTCDGNWAQNRRIMFFKLVRAI